MGKPGLLQSVGLQRVRHDLVTEQQQQQLLLLEKSTLKEFEITDFYVSDLKKNLR